LRQILIEEGITLISIKLSDKVGYQRHKRNQQHVIKGNNFQQTGIAAQT